MKIANILTNDKIDVTEEYNIVTNIIDIIPNLPTLIIGYEYVKTNYPNFDITEIKLADNLFWTFRKLEKRDKYERDLDWFLKFSYSNLTKNINYIFIDPLHNDRKRLIKIIKKVYSLKNPITFLNNDFCYIYDNDLIFGLDLNLLKIIGLNTDRVLKKIKIISDVFLSNGNILIEYKETLKKVNNNVRYIPFLYRLKNEKNDTISFIHR